MNKILGRLPLSAKLVMIGLIPLVFALFSSFQLYREKAVKLSLLESHIDKVHQSALITRLIDQVQLERKESYSHVLSSNIKNSMPAERRRTDSLIQELIRMGNGLKDFRKYTFLSNLDSVRGVIDAGYFSPDRVIHFYSTITFRLNTLNSVPIAASIYLPQEYPDLISQKLLSEMITYLGIINTNIHNVLYTRKYVSETLFGTYGTYEVYNSFKDEFLLKAPQPLLAKYDSIMAQSGMTEHESFLKKVFATFKIDSTYDSNSWRTLSISVLGSLRNLQEDLLHNVENSMEKIYRQEKNSTRNAKLLLIVISFIVLLILFLIIRSVNSSLLRLKHSAQRISKGAPIVNPPKQSNDVIGSLGTSIMEIDRNNRILATAAYKIGNGDFNVEVKPRGDDDLLGNAVVQMKQNLREFTGRLAESETHIRQLLQALPACVYTCDKEGNILEFNSAAISLWGGSPAPLEHRWGGVEKMYSVEGMEIDRNEFPMAMLLKGHKVNEQEVVIERKDGTRKSVITSPQLIVDSNNKVTGAIDVMIDISDRKQIEKDTAWLAAIINSTVDAIISKTLDGIVTSWNPGAERIFGFSAAEMIGQPILKIIPKDRLNEEPEILAKMQNGISIDHFETRRLRKDGRLIDISISLSPIVDKNGKVIGASKIARDITEKVEIARKINENEERLRMAIAATKLGTWDVMLPGNKVLWSEEAKKIFGIVETPITMDEFIGRVFPEDREMFKSRVSSAISNKEDGNFDAVFRMKRFSDDELRWIHAKAKASFNEKGEAQRFLGTVLDITDTKAAQRAFEESEQRTRFAIQAAQMGTFEWNLETNVFVSSPRLNEIFGSVDGTHVDLISRIHPDDIEIRNKAVEESKKLGSLEYEVRVVWPDGSIHWVNVFGKIIYSAPEQPMRMYGTVKDVTRERNIIRDLKDSEERLKIAIEAAEMGTWELDYQTRAVKYSNRYLQLMGFQADSHPTHDELLARIHPDHMAIRNKAMKDAVQTGRLDYEMRILIPPGREKWIRAKGTFFYDRNGNPERALGTILDITDQKNAIHVLQESEERFKTIANSAPVMIWMSGQDKFSDFFNTSWLEYTGRTIEQEIGDGWLNGVHPDDKEYCIETYQRSYKERKAFYMEYRLRRKDGAYRFISDNAVPRFDGNGKFIGFISACRDIDDEKMFNQKVKESELLFKTIANVSPVGLWMTDATGSTTFVNDTWLDWTGIPNVEQFGDGWMRVVILADTEYVAKKFRQAFDSRKSYFMEFRIKRRDGKVRWVLSNGSPYFDIEGNFAGYAGSVADITERKEDEIRKNEFLAIASHELKTPLTSVKAYTQLLSATYQKTGDVFLKNALGKVENQVNKMTKLVSDFLNLSKIESDKFELHPEKFELSSLVKEVSSDIQLVAPNHRISVEDGHPVTIEGDSEKIAQVVTNFLTNAIKYSPEGKEITVTVTHDDKLARVSVRDQGIGVKPEEQNQIFQRFYRSKFNQNISYSGFGIGLYISAEIIQKHEGTIGVESKDGQGSIFYFTLPLAR